MQLPRGGNSVTAASSLENTLDHLRFPSVRALHESLSLLLLLEGIYSVLAVLNGCVSGDRRHLGCGFELVRQLLIRGDVVIAAKRDPSRLEDLYQSHPPHAA